MPRLPQFNVRNGWRIESTAIQGYSVRVCRNAADCAADVWGYYTPEQVKRNVHLIALRLAAKSKEEKL